MRDTRPSFTAGFVAACRGLGRALADDAQIADDPFATSLVGPLAGRAIELAVDHRGPVISELASRFPFVLYMQVRTRVLDDAVRDFAATGGAQVVLLGAGFDARAARLPNLKFFEVDHPATQERKRARVLDSRATYVAFHFERDPMSTLPDVLARHGHDPTRPTLTIWEGVTMYLTEPAIEASLAAIHAYSCGASGSVLAMTYFDRERIDSPSALRRVSRAVVASVGEPFRWGIRPADLPAFFESRGFSLRDDQDIVDHATRLLPARYARRLRRGTSRVAIAAISHT